MTLFFSVQRDFKTIKKYEKTTNILRKPVISTPLKSVALNGSQKAL